VALLVSLSGNMSEVRLKEWGKEVKEELQQIPAISKVNLSGTRKYEIGVEVSEERLRKYNISFNQVASAIRNSNLNMAGGTIRTKGEEIRIRTMGRKYTGKQLSKIVVLTGSSGEIITLDRIAEINDGFSEDPISATVDGKPSIFINVLKTSKEDSLAISEAVISYVKNKKNMLPSGANIQIIFDTTDFLKARINLLIKNGVIGLCLVFILLWIFLDHRLSFWAGMGIPISIGGGLVLLWMMDRSINMISLFGLIMVLGIIVDDAIIVGEAIFVHRQNGDSPLDAAINGVMEVGMPVVSAVTTTIVAFSPLLFVDGVMGSFIAILPAVVIACLLFSLIECILLLPAHLNHLPDPDETDKDKPDTLSAIWNKFKQINKKAD
jgi:multidrug efflux pump subunit AcrB